MAGKGKHSLLELLPAALLSRTFGAVAEVRLPRRVQGKVNALFARAVGASVAEAERSPDDYPSLNAFFTRRLAPGVHQVADGEGALVCPVDGRLSAHGRIEDGTLIQAKGRDYQAADLLADPAAAERFEGGSYATLYLSPRDYHRIHSPVTGRVTGLRYAPGRLLPVNALGVRHVAELFPRNERLISYVDSRGGRAVAVVKVGATCVGRISVTYDDMLTNQGAHRGGFGRSYEPAIPIEAGAELGAFNLGSTVVLLIEGDFAFEPDLAEGPVRMGQRLGRWRS